MSASQCSYVPRGRLRCPFEATFVASVTVGDGHLRRVCTRHLAATCRELDAISSPVVVGVIK